MVRAINILLILLSLSVLICGCETTTGESYINLPEGPKILFRGGFGKITIRYTPPPDPIFQIANATEYIEFEYIKKNFGVPDKPFLVEYTVESSVSSFSPIEKTSDPNFNDYIGRVVRSWIYTRYGVGPMRIKIDVPKKRITVDDSQIRLAEQEPGRPAPRKGNVRDMVRQTGFTVVSGSLY